MIYRTLYQIEVFSEGPFDPGTAESDRSDLAAIDHAINEGDCIGSVVEVSSEVVPADEVHAHMLRIGNDGDFFAPCIDISLAGKRDDSP